MQIEPLCDEYVDLLKSHTIDIFESMIDMAPAEIELGTLSSNEVTNEVVGSLGFAGTAQGLFVLSTTLDVAKAVYCGMMCMEADEIEDECEVMDGMGEVLNMVVGNFKNSWVDAGKAMDLAIPQMTSGTPVTFSARKSTSGGSLTLSLPAGDLRIEARFHESRAAK